MDRFICLAVLVAAVMLGSVAFAEGAVPVKVVKTLGPRVLIAAQNVGNKISNFLWRNKGTIATGVVLTTFAANPGPFVDGATTVTTTMMGKMLGTAISYFILAALLVAGVAAAVFAVREVRWRQHLVPIAVCLLTFFVICCCGVAVRADEIGVVSTIAAPGFFPSLRGFLDFVLIVLTLLPLAFGS